MGIDYNFKEKQQQMTINKNFEIYIYQSQFDIIDKSYQRDRKLFITNCLSTKFGQLIENNEEYESEFIPIDLIEKKKLEKDIFFDSVYFAIFSFFGIFINIYNAYQINRMIIELGSAENVEEQFLFAKVFDCFSTIFETISNIYVITAVIRLCTFRFSICIIAVCVSFIFSSISGILVIRHKVEEIDQSLVYVVIYFLLNLIWSCINIWYYLALQHNMEVWIKKFTLPAPSETELDSPTSTKFSDI